MIMAIILLMLIPSPILMDIVNERIAFGESDVINFNFDPVAVGRIMVDGRGSCGHQAAVLSQLLAWQGKESYVVGLMTCPEEACGHTVVYSEGMWLDVTNKRVYNDSSFFDHQREVWIAPNRTISEVIL